MLAASRDRIRLIEKRFGDATRELFGIDPAALATSEAGYLGNFRDADALRARAARAEEQRTRRLAAKGLSERDDRVVNELRLSYEQRPGEHQQLNFDFAGVGLTDLDQAGIDVSTTQGNLAGPGGDAPRTVALGISPDFVHQGVVDLTGYRVTSAEDLATRSFDATKHLTIVSPPQRG